MAKAPRNIQIPGDDLPAEHEPGILDADDDYDAEPEPELVPHPEPEQAPEPVDAWALTREQIAYMPGARVAAMFGQVNHPDGTPLDDVMEPCASGAPEQRYVVGRLLTRDGWLVGVAVPIN